MYFSFDFGWYSSYPFQYCPLRTREVEDFLLNRLNLLNVTKVILFVNSPPAYQHKKEIFLPSTMNKANIVNVRKKSHSGVQKPKVIHDYS